MGHTLLHARAIEDRRYELTVSASSADVLLALADFGPMRAQIWPETSHSRVYRVHEVGGSRPTSLKAFLRRGAASGTTGRNRASSP